MRNRKFNDSTQRSPPKSSKGSPKHLLQANKDLQLNRENHSFIVIYNKKIKSFSNVEIKENCSFIDLSLNYLSNFTNFPSSLLHLSTLILDNNRIRSFNGFQLVSSFPKLRFLSLKKNPIAQNLYFKIMCLIIFGNQLHAINGEKINDNQRQTANKIRKSAIQELVQGKVITSLHPLRIQEPIIEKPKIDHQINHNDRKNSPNRKEKNGKKSPTKRSSISNYVEPPPSVGCLVHMFSNSNLNDIEKVVQHQFQKTKKNVTADEDDHEDSVISSFSLLSAVLDIKQRINRLKTKFNDGISIEKIDNEDETFSDKKYDFQLIENKNNQTLVESQKEKNIKEDEQKSPNKQIQNSIKIDQLKTLINEEEKKKLNNEKSKLNHIESENQFNEPIQKLNDTKNDQKILNNENENSFNEEKKIAEKYENKNENVKEEKYENEDNKVKQNLTKNDYENIKYLMKEDNILSFKIIEDPSINSDLELAFNFPEPCQELILDFDD